MEMTPMGVNETLEHLYCGKLQKEIEVNITRVMSQCNFQSSQQIILEFCPQILTKTLIRKFSEKKNSHSPYQYVDYSSEKRRSKISPTETYQQIFF